MHASTFTSVCSRRLPLGAPPGQRCLKALKMRGSRWELWLRSASSTGKCSRSRSCPASSLPSSRVSFVREHNEEILQLVHEYGAVLLRGWGSDSGKLSQISAALRLATTDMACSAGPRFEVAKNIFTANEAPPSERIPFHHEMAQVCEAEFVRPWSCALGGSMSVGVADGAHVVKRSWKTECMLCLPSASLLCLFLSSHADEPPPPRAFQCLQCDKPPSVVCFFCDTAAPHGGATPILQSHLAATYLRTRHPEVADKLVEKEVRYVRIMPPVTDPSSALGKSWRHSLRVESEAEAEAKLAELESTWTWLPGGMLRTVTKPMPAVLREERTGREVFFTAAESTLNSIVDEVNGIGATESQANDIRPIKAIIYGDGSPLDEATKLALHDVTQYMIAQQVAVPWQPGDALLIDNATVQHSREAFTPPRRILASLVGGLSKVGSLHEVPQATKTPMMSVSPSTTMDMLQMGKQPSMSL